MNHHSPSTSNSKETSGSQNPNPTLGQIDDHSGGLSGVEEGIASVSIQEHAAAAAEIIESPSSSSVNGDDDSAESFGDLAETEAASNHSEQEDEDEDDDEDDVTHNVMTISLEFQLVKNALILLKSYLLCTAFTGRYSGVGDMAELRVITNCSECKQAIVEYLETENLEWKEEENKRTLRIKVNGDKKFEVMKISLRGEHVETAMEFLKRFLIFGAIGGFLGELKVVTGFGGSSTVKQTVVEYLEREKMEWKEENKATLVIKFNSNSDLSAANMHLLNML